MRFKRAGVNLLEVVLAVFVFLVATLILFRAFSSNKRLALQGRDRTAAQLLMSNLVEEVKAHPFGLPPPEEWPKDDPPSPGWESLPAPTTQQILVNVEGHSQKMIFHRQMSWQGSFVGAGEENFDVVTLRISWHDPGHPKLQTLEARLVVKRR